MHLDIVLIAAILGPTLAFPNSVEWIRERATSKADAAASSQPGDETTSSLTETLPQTEAALLSESGTATPLHETAGPFSSEDENTTPLPETSLQTEAPPLFENETATTSSAEESAPKKAKFFCGPSVCVPCTPVCSVYGGLGFGGPWAPPFGPWMVPWPGPYMPAPIPPIPVAPPQPAPANPAPGPGIPDIIPNPLKPPIPDVVKPLIPGPLKPLVGADNNAAQPAQPSAPSGFGIGGAIAPFGPFGPGVWINWEKGKGVRGGIKL
ncbi:hypothetical protein V3C99_009297 [Haemonchus contortus]